MKEINDRFEGITLGQFTVEEKIGQGGMGAVYKGLDRLRQIPVAIKIMPESSLDDEEAVRRFDREARIVEKVHHVNVAQVFQSGSLKGIPYYVMEFIDGSSLAEVINERGRVGGQFCIDYIRQSAQGLRAAGQHMVTHRDIKPANIMVTQSGIIKIVDFGIAKAQLEDSFKTATGTVMGTAMYMSPEQAKGQEVDLRSDIYSLGATFYHIITGQRPFDDDNPLTVMMKHTKVAFQPILEINPNVPPRLVNILNQMVEKEPDDRFQDYDEILEAMDNIYSVGRVKNPRSRPLKRVESSSSDMGEPVRPPDSNIMFLPLLFGVGLILVACMIVAVILFGPKPSEDGSSPTPSSVQETGAGSRRELRRQGINFIKGAREQMELERDAGVRE